MLWLDKLVNIPLIFKCDIKRSREQKVEQDNFFRGDFFGANEMYLQAIQNTLFNSNNNSYEHLNVNFILILWCYNTRIFPTPETQNLNN